MCCSKSKHKTNKQKWFNPMGFDLNSKCYWFCLGPANLRLDPDSLSQFCTAKHLWCIKGPNLSIAAWNQSVSHLAWDHEIMGSQHSLRLLLRHFLDAVWATQVDFGGWDYSMTVLPCEACVWFTSYLFHVFETPSPLLSSECMRPECQQESWRPECLHPDRKQW